MKGNWKEFIKEKHLFKTTYCLTCKQKKVCGQLDSEYCCFCYYENEQEKNKEYSSYEKTLVIRGKEHQENFQQLQLLQNYQGCQHCKSREVDAYFLYEEKKLTCQPCRMRKEGSSSSPISFSWWNKWYQKHWKIDLQEWLEKGFLPVNTHCAKKWLENPKHLNNCDCLEQESKEIYDLFANSLKEHQEKLRNCSCKKSEKVRVSSDNYAWCERCDKTIAVASKKRVIKNRNDPNFWGLNIKEKILCLPCLKKFQEQMPISKKYTFNKYLKRYDF